MTHALHITLAQINPAVGDISGNIAKIRKIQAEAQGDLVVFPELAVCGYPAEDLILKPYFLDQVEGAVRAFATESKGPWMIVPAPHRANGKTYNAAHVIGDGKIQATVLKYDLPNNGVFDERRVFTAGPLPEPVTIAGHKIGLLICEDTWTAAVAGNLKKTGAEILISVNASPFEMTKHGRRLGIARDRVKETGLPLIYVNRTGGQDDVVYDGASFVLNEKGGVVLQAGQFAEETHHTVWEKAPGGTHWLCAAGMITKLPEGPESIYKALVMGLRDYVTRNGFPGVLIGLSGGIDSALSAAVAVDALGKDMVHGVLLPSKYTSPDSIEDAEMLVKNLGITSETISIERTVAAFEAELQDHALPGLAQENIQSRCRGLILMAISNTTGKMVLSTGNKSEMAVGYATLYGDMCGGFNVLKDVYKTKVYELARWRGAVIPERSLTKAPTAELRPGQTDQDSLPPYEVLDAILEGLIEGDKGPDEFPARDRETVVKVWQMLDRAEYKRRQSAPGVKVTTRAFGRDRRYPITHDFRPADKKEGR